MSFKNAPLGMKIIFVLFLVGLASIVRNLLQDPSSMFGFAISGSGAIIVNIIYLIVQVYLIIAIYKGFSWGSVVVLQGLRVIDFLITYIIFMTTPLAELFGKYGTVVSDRAQSLLGTSIESKVKLIITAPMLLGLIIGIWILVYIYKKKDYFSNEGILD